MDKPTLYMDTTIPGYLLAEPSRDVLVVTRQEVTRTWWHRDHARFAVCVSDAVLDEAERGDRRAAKRHREFLDQFPVLPGTSEVQQVADLYFRERIVPSQEPRMRPTWPLPAFTGLSSSAHGTSGTSRTPLPFGG